MKDFEQNKQALSAEVPMISIGDIKQEQSEPDASGSCADVFCCKWNGTTVALKKMRMKLKSTEHDLIHLEATIGFHLRHPNIIQMFGLTRLINNHLGIIMEWADQGSLGDHMTSLTEVQKIHICICICRGLQHMHSLGIAHRDVKPQNVLLFGDKTLAKISDFGTSKAAHTIQAAASSIVGTPKYSPPELMQKGNLSFSYRNEKT